MPVDNGSRPASTNSDNEENYQQQDTFTEKRVSNASNRSRQSEGSQDFGSNNSNSPSVSPKKKSSVNKSASSNGSQTRLRRRDDSNKTLVPRAAVKSNVRRFYCYINRDMNTQKTIVTVDMKHVPDMERFLDTVQAQLKPEFGVIRSIVHLQSGSTVKELNEIQDLEDYVVVGNKRYKPLPYGDIVDQRTKEQQQQLRNQKAEAELLRKTSMAHANAKPHYLEGITSVPKMILVVYNGDRTGDHTKVKLNPRDAEDYTKVLETVTAKIQTQLRFGNVIKLFTLDGKEVDDVSAIKDARDGGVYVAVDRYPFKSPYLKWTPEGNLVKIKPKLMPIRRGSKLDLSADPSKIGWDYLIQHSEIVQEEILNEIMCEVSIEAMSDMIAGLEKLKTEASQKLENLNSMDNITRLYDDQILDILDIVMRAPEENEAPFEEIVRTKYKDAIEAAFRGKLAHWETDPVAFVALVILLDQFPRSLYRNTLRMYQYDSRAKEIVLRCIESGIMDQIDPAVYRLFPCFALAHQEDVEMIRLSLREWDKVADQFPNSDPIWDTVRGFKNNLDIVEKFGRFPGRNELLGRTDTEEEKEFLRNGGILQQPSPKKKSLFKKK